MSGYIEREIPQARYGTGIRSGQLDTIYFDMRITDLQNLSPEQFRPEWGYAWTNMECGQKWSIRVHVSVPYPCAHIFLIPGQWPGYGVLSRQINVKDHGRVPQPVSKHKLGQRAARAVQSIMEVRPPSLACAAGPTDRIES